MDNNDMFKPPEPKKRQEDSLFNEATQVVSPADPFDAPTQQMPKPAAPSDPFDAPTQLAPKPADPFAAPTQVAAMPADDPFGAPT